MKSIKAMVVIASTVAMTGCAGLTGPSFSGLAVSGSQAQVQSIVEFGVVLDVKSVQIEQSGLGVGTLAGAGVGGLLGSMVGHGAVRGIGIVVGALGGGAVGQTLSNGASQKQGIQLTIQKQNGQAVAIVQSGPEQFTRGEKVQLVTSQGKTRVSSIQ